MSSIKIKITTFSPIILFLFLFFLQTSSIPSIQIYPIEDYSFSGNYNGNELKKRGWTFIDAPEQKEKSKSSKWEIKYSKMEQSNLLDSSVPYHHGTVLRRPLSMGWSDVDLETTIAFNRGSSSKQGTAGLIFRMTNDQTYYRAYVSTWSNTLVLDRVIDAQHRTIATTGMAAISNDQTFVLKVRAISSRITLYIDNVIVIDVIDPKHRERESGTIGLYVSGSLDRTKFGYLRVAPPPSLLEFTYKDGTVPSSTASVSIGIPFVGYAQGRLKNCSLTLTLRLLLTRTNISFFYLNILFIAILFIVIFFITIFFIVIFFIVIFFISSLDKI